MKLAERKKLEKPAVERLEATVNLLGWQCADYRADLRMSFDLLETDLCMFEFVVEQQHRIEDFAKG